MRGSLVMACLAACAPPTTSEQTALGEYGTRVMALSPVGYWRFDELSGSTMHDTSGGTDGRYSGLYRLGVPGAIEGSTAVFLDQDYRLFNNTIRFEQGRGTIPDRDVYSLTRDWDDFGGSSGSWGGAWHCQRGCTDVYRRGGGVASIHPTSEPAIYEQDRATRLAAGELQIRVRWLSPAAGGPLVPVALIAQRTDENNHVRAELVEDPDDLDRLALRIVKTVDGVEQILASRPLGTFGDGIWWILRVRFDGTAIAARAWPEDLSQPASWLVEAPLTSAAAGTVGVRYDPTGGTARPTVEYSDFWVQSPGFSVSMFVYPSSSQLFGTSFPFGKSQHGDEWGQDSDEYYFRHEGGRGSFKGYVFNRDGHYGAGGRAENIAYDRWHHVVFSLDPGDYRDRSAGVTFYWDGVKTHAASPGGGPANYYHQEDCLDACDESRTCAVAGEAERHPCWLITPRGGDKPVTIGQVGSARYQGFRGAFDELAIFDHKLTDAEVASLCGEACEQ